MGNRTRLHRGFRDSSFHFGDRRIIGGFKESLGLDIRRLPKITKGIDILPKIPDLTDLSSVVNGYQEIISGRKGTLLEPGWKALDSVLEREEMGYVIAVLESEMGRFKTGLGIDDIKGARKEGDDYLFLTKYGAVFSVRNIPGRFTAFNDRYFSEELGILILCSRETDDIRVIWDVKLLEKVNSWIWGEILILEINDTGGRRMVPFTNNDGVIQEIDDFIKLPGKVLFFSGNDLLGFLPAVTEEQLLHNGMSGRAFLVGSDGSTRLGKKVVKSVDGNIYVADGNGLIYQLGYHEVGAKRIADTDFYYLLFPSIRKESESANHDRSGDLRHVMVLKADFSEIGYQDILQSAAELEMFDYFSNITTFATEDGVVKKGYLKEVKLIFGDGSTKEVRIYIEDEYFDNMNPKYRGSKRAVLRLGKLSDVLTRLPKDFFDRGGPDVFYIHLRPKKGYKIRNERYGQKRAVDMPLYDFDNLTAGQDGVLSVYREIVRRSPWLFSNVAIKAAAAEEVTALSNFLRTEGESDVFALPEKVVFRESMISESSWSVDRGRINRVFDKVHGLEAGVTLYDEKNNIRHYVKIKIETENRERFINFMKEIIIPVLSEIPLQLFYGVKSISFNKKGGKNVGGSWCDYTGSIYIFGEIERLNKERLKSTIIHEMGHAIQLSNRHEIKARTALAIAAGDVEQSRYLTNRTGSPYHEESIGETIAEAATLLFNPHLREEFQRRAQHLYYVLEGLLEGEFQ